jgi:hypothetical protein
MGFTPNGNNNGLNHPMIKQKTQDSLALQGIKQLSNIMIVNNSVNPIKPNIRENRNIATANNFYSHKSGMSVGGTHSGVTFNGKQ